MIIKPGIIFRCEFDDTGILFNPDNGKIFGLNPNSKLIWECLEKNMDKPEILATMATYVDSLPEHIGVDYDEFIEQLRIKELVS